MTTKHGVYVTSSVAGNANVKTTVNMVPYVMGTAYGATGGDAPLINKKITGIDNFAEVFGWNGADYNTPDPDYTLEVFAYVYFNVCKNTPVIMRNVYSTAAHAAGVSAVAASDFVTDIDEIDKTFVEFGIVPFFFLIPGYSEDSALRTAMYTKISLHDGIFETIVIVDGLETNTPTLAIADAAAIVTDGVAYTYPKFAGYDFSITWVSMAVMAARENGDMPINGPSNYNVKNGGIGDGILTPAATDKALGLGDANDLNDAGISTWTAFGTTGYVVWGPWMVSYDSSGAADYINDTYIPKAMDNYIKQLIVFNVWENVDEPGNKREVQAVVDKLNAILGALQGKGGVLGYAIDFLEADNPDTSLAVGTYTFRVTTLTPKEMSDIEVAVTIDTAYFATLFA